MGNIDADKKGVKTKRFLLKLSGEALTGEQKTGYDDAFIDNLVNEIASITKKSEENVQMAIVIGGGNYWRGRSSENMDRVKADQIGMLATVMNCIYVADKFRNAGVCTKIMTPFACGSMTELFSKDKALEALNNKEIVFFAGGTGHPYFSTDMGAALMAVEIEADAILAGKSIDGVYDSDPNLNPEAKKYSVMEMKDIVNRQLGVIDLAAAVLSMENHMPMYLFGLDHKDCIVEAVKNYNRLTSIAEINPDTVEKMSHEFCHFGTFIKA